VRAGSAELIVAADGAGSAVRQAMVDRDQCQASEERLPHDTRNCWFPRLPAGVSHGGQRAAHLAGGYMLIALPNADGSFTATLFRHRGQLVRQLQTAAAVQAFSTAQFPDFVLLVPRPHCAVRRIRRGSWRPCTVKPSMAARC
jgi:kynurenine 3-monooxygenase